jgi:hypothetical protein
MPRFSVRREMSAPEGGPGLTRAAGRNGLRVPMSRALRATLLAVCAVLWLSGCAWLVLHFAFAQHTQFGSLPNPWEALLLRVHGIVAVAGVFLLGWVAAGHLIDRWGGSRNRLSGTVLAGSAALLVLSGYALYYTTGALHEVAAGVHECLGVAALVAALAHWWGSSSASSATRTIPTRH